MSRSRVAKWSVAVVTVLACAPLWAQQQAAPVAPPQPTAPSPAASVSADPAVETILATNPTTPAELVEAAKILADLRRPDLAKGLLRKLLAAKPGGEELAGLERQFGSLLFLSLASRAELAPEGRQVADLVLDAVQQQLHDPARIEAAIQQLQDPSVDVRYQAFDNLRKSRGTAVGPMLAVLADPKRAPEHAAVRSALVRMGADAVGPLVAGLDAKDVRTKVAAVQVLGQMGRRDLTLYLLAPYASKGIAGEIRAAAEKALVDLLGNLPTDRAAADLLAQRARDYFDRREPLDEEADGRVEVWSWDAAAKEPRRTITLSDDARRWWAARLARDAYRIEPDDPQIRVLYLATTLEMAAYAKGLDRPLDVQDDTAAATAATLGTETVDQTLDHAMATGHAPAAAASARILGQIGKAEMLYQGSQPAPLVRAVQSDDRRLRFAAAEAIIRLKPDRTFAGASFVPKALSFFACSRGQARAIVAGANIEEDRRIGGYLGAMGYTVDAASTGRDLVALAIGSPDYELILVDSAIEHPTAEFLLQQLRRDYRTADVPVGVLARDGRLPRAEHIVRNDRLAAAFSRPHDPEAAQWQVAGLRKLAGSEFVPAAVRQEQAARSLEWLLAMSAEKSTVYENLQRLEETALAALSNPVLRTSAIILLGRIGTPETQTALADTASRGSLPLDVRKAAADAFWQSTAEHGILLTTRQILRQYDRYRASQQADQATQAVLRSILRSIESRTRLMEPDQPEMVHGAPE